VLLIVRALATKVISEAVALPVSTRFSDDEKLEALRQLDQFRQWHSLDDKRYCLVCGKIITGREIQLTGGTRGNGSLRVSCPTDGCNSIAMDWVLPTSEILAKVEKLAEEARKVTPTQPPAVIAGNSKTGNKNKSREHLASRLRKLGFHFKRHAKAVPSNPCGP
jgi:hypothetical protein